MEIKYTMSQEEVIQGKVEARKIGRFYRVNKKRMMFSYFPLLLWVLCPIVLYIKWQEEGLAQGIKIGVTGFLISFIIIYFVSRIIVDYFNNKVDKTFQEGLRNLYEKQLNELIDIKISIGSTIKIESNEKVELSYKSIAGIIEEDNNIFIEYCENKMYYIPSKVFKDNDERYRFIDILRKNYELYKEVSLEEPKASEYDFMIKYDMGEIDFKNIVNEDVNAVLLKKVTKTTKLYSLMIQYIVIFFVILLGILFRDINFLIIVGVLIGGFYYYNKIAVPIASKKRMMQSVKKEIKDREIQFICIKDENIFFRDNLRVLKQELNTNNTGVFTRREDYLVHTKNGIPNFYIPYRAFQNKDDIEKFIDYFK